QSHGARFVDLRRGCQTYRQEDGIHAEVDQPIHSRWLEVLMPRIVLECACPYLIEGFLVDLEATFLGFVMAPDHLRSMMTRDALVRDPVKPFPFHESQSALHRFANLFLRSKFIGWRRWGLSAGTQAEQKVREAQREHARSPARGGSTSVYITAKCYTSLFA